MKLRNYNTLNKVLEENLCKAIFAVPKQKPRWSIG